MKLVQYGLAVAVAAVVAAAGNVEAQCVTKAGQGTNTTEEGAKSQAYEAVLQATDWGMWSVWMGQGMKYAAAPGYKVSNVKARCKKGDSARVCCAGQALQVSEPSLTVTDRPRDLQKQRQTCACARKY